MFLKQRFMNKKENIVISACLLGLHCRYNQTGAYLRNLNELMERYHLIPVCPEIMGGMGIPRRPAERKGDKIIDNSGQDVTRYYELGALETRKLARLYNCRYAILKENSPSCGYGRIYDGTFSGTLIDGNGVTADLLSENGLTVLGESQVFNLLDP